MNSYEWGIEKIDIISKKDLKKFMARNNKIGLIRLFIHLGAITATGYFLYLTMFTWWCVPLLLLQGIFIAFLFAPMHEACHSSAFRTRSLNVLVGRFTGLIMLRPFFYLKYRHMAHHTYTQHPLGDPDRVDFPRSISEYLTNLSGYNIWLRMLKNIYSQMLGRFTEEERAFIPKNELHSVVIEARIMILTYTIVMVVSAYFQSGLALYLWLLPRVLGEPALRAMRMIEHTGMAESPNMLENTRTTKSNIFIRFFYWNMPFHAEHHLYPSVPFHALPRLHTVVKSHLKEVAPGIFSVHLSILKEMQRNRNQIVDVEFPTI